MLTVIDHPLIKHKLTVMRKKDTEVGVESAFAINAVE